MGLHPHEMLRRAKENGGRGKDGKNELIMYDIYGHPLKAGSVGIGIAVEGEVVRKVLLLK